MAGIDVVLVTVYHQTWYAMAKLTVQTGVMKLQSVVRKSAGRHR